ncbi:MULTISPECIES: hypothetical protein [unclassified Ruminococcus]|uniref:hypothetical protein n=1 Tax=unclassified Ruminococcus TaxID=2608920 RepID=UPI00210C6070|nr:MULTISPECIES: hypothetical protein [unclassified Ruminococcus]MCQ4022092.1 hypothetical protein [Ruminococcus sp. zg-924]MCQ4114412.1 hypothetical protein [Ruminococcus sp. zg-921]
MDMLSELPLGFSMALAKNPDALIVFSKLPDSDKQAVLSGTHNVKSKVEMQEYVNNLTVKYDG